MRHVLGLTTGVMGLTTSAMGLKTSAMGLMTSVMGLTTSGMGLMTSGNMGKVWNVICWKGIVHNSIAVAMMKVCRWRRVIPTTWMNSSLRAESKVPLSDCC
jgi:hypothetical protein